MSVENKEKLIDSVRKRAILYDLSHVDYKDEFKKNQIWELVGEENEMSGMYVLG